MAKAEQVIAKSAARKICPIRELYNDIEETALHERLSNVKKRKKNARDDQLISFACFC
jgi:hypothetical protein